MSEPKFIRVYNLESEVIAINVCHIMTFKEEKNGDGKYLEVMMVSGEVLAISIAEKDFQEALEKLYYPPLGRLPPA